MIGWETWGTILESPDSKSFVLPLDDLPMMTKTVAREDGFKPPTSGSRDLRSIAELLPNIALAEEVGFEPTTFRF